MLVESVFGSMKIIKGIQGFRDFHQKAVLTIGNFDGLHLGHQKVLAIARQKADRYRCKLLAMTFEPHPVAVIKPDKALGVLTPLAYKKQLMAEQAVDYLVILEARKDLLAISYRDFIEKIILPSMDVAEIVEGDDFNFGAGRDGNVQMLKQLLAGRVAVTEVESRYLTDSKGQPIEISSTMIRAEILAGHVAQAANLLGRNYRLAGEIVSGKSLGKGIGFPTLNLSLSKIKSGNQIIPADGVYVGNVKIADDMLGLQNSKMIPAAVSIGHCSSIADGLPLTIEAHLLTDKSIEMNKKFIAIDFVDFVRCQKKFDNIEELTGQIAKDCEKIGKKMPF